MGKQLCLYLAFWWLQIATTASAADVLAVSVQNLRESLEGPFGVIRHHVTNPEGKAAARRHITETFRRHGLNVTLQDFTGPTVNPGKNGTNIIGVKRGKLYGSSEDKIVAVGAHYDTVSTSPGVDDDGSGMAAMLEMMRVMTSCSQQNYTTIFVAFDHEEAGASQQDVISSPCNTEMGSDDFVCSWLLPFIESSGQPEFQGIFMLETIMNYDPRPNVQTFPIWFPAFFQSIHQELQSKNFSGGFISLIHKPDEAELVSSVQQAWEERAREPAGASTLDINLQITGRPSEAETTLSFEFLGRSDCLSFWVREPYFRCVFVTDTANYRGTMQHCYHSPCDDVTSITPEKLNFLAKVTDSLLQATLKLAEVDVDSCTSVTGPVSTSPAGPVSASPVHGAWTVPLVLSALVAWCLSTLQFSLAH